MIKNEINRKCENKRHSEVSKKKAGQSLWLVAITTAKSKVRASVLRHG